MAKSFSKKPKSGANLKRHIQGVHDGEKPHICGQCGNSYSQKNNLKMHIQGVDFATIFGSFEKLLAIKPTLPLG